MYKLVLLLSTLLLVFSGNTQEVTHTHSVHHAFIENKGQWGDHVFFKNKVDGGNMWVEQGRVLFQLQDYSQLEEAHSGRKELEEDLIFKEKLVTLEFVGAQAVNQIEKSGATEHYYNYFIGKDKNKWTSEVRGFEEFILKEIYSGIDLKFIEQEQQVKYEFIVNPGIATEKIKLKYSYHDELYLDRKGNLMIKTEIGEIVEEKPFAYQIVNGKIVEVQCDFELHDNYVSFKLGDYNKRVALVIDPVLVFATYNGAATDNFGMTATYGYDGSAYIAGTVYGNGYPMPDADAYDIHSNFTVVNNGMITTDAFITKYSSDGTNMLWSTFYGGGNSTQGTDVPHSLICDFDNNIYVYGTTSSVDFPIVNGFQSNHGGGSPFSLLYNGTNFGIQGTDIYVVKFSANGHNLLGSTYVGGDQNDGVSYSVGAGNYGSLSAYDSLTTNYGDQFRGEIMLDSVNNIIIGSCTRSSNFPMQNAFQPTKNGHQDGVIFKLKNDFSGLIFSSYYGGSKADAIYSVKIDSSQNIVFGGGTNSPDLNILTGAYQNTYGGGVADGFIGKLTPDGLNLTHSTYLGTPQYDQIFFIEIDRLDNVFVLGQNKGGGFPIINAAYSNPNSGQFITKLSPDLSTVLGSTVIGSGNNSYDLSLSAFLVDICGNMYLSGWGGSVLPGSSPMSGLPVTPNAFQSTPPSGYDFYLMVIERDFNSLLYGSYMGSASSKEHVDGSTSRFDKKGVVYQGVCGGCGGHSDFPTTPGAWSSQNLSTNCNALVFKFDFNLIPNAKFTVDNTLGCAPFEVSFSNFSSDSDSYLWDFGDGNADSITLEPVITYTQAGTYEVMLTVTDSICLLTDTALIIIEVLPAIDLENIPDIDLCKPDTIILTVNANGTADTFVWSSNSNFTDTLNLSLADSTVRINDPVDGWYYIMASNPGCSAIDSVQFTFTSASLVLEGNTNLCLGEETVITASSNTNAVTFIDFDWQSDSIIVSGDGTSIVTVQPSVSEYVYVTAEANNGCILFDSIFVSVSDISSIIASASESSVPTGTNVTLSAEPDGYTYSWTPVDNLENPNAQETDATVYITTTYTVSVSDGVCTKTASITVNAFPYTCAEPFIFVPNAFTPNGDGENDALYIRSMIVEDVLFRIYDRWGEMVYETTTMHSGWDGTFRGKELAPDVYDYYLEGNCIDGQEFLIKGNITLIR